MTPLVQVDYAFVPAGTSAEPIPGRLFVDVGNGFGPGVLDHHAPGTPGACSAQLALAHPDLVLSQVDASRRVTVVTHRYPDMDAISGVFFAVAHLRGEPLDAAAREWASYVCRVDRGFTALDPARPINPYSVLMRRLARAGEAGKTPDDVSEAMLEAGLGFVESVLNGMRRGFRLDDSKIVERLSLLTRDVAAVRADHADYLEDVLRAEQFVCRLPRKNGEGLVSVPAIWIHRPDSALFKSWARGDRREASRPQGFIFTGVQVGPERAILSVAPDAGVTLRGLGDRLEAAEKAKRERLGCLRTGPARAGFDAPDPWYDGRSALHEYTIVDAPRDGTLLSPEEVREAFEQYLRQLSADRVPDADE